MTLPVEVSMKQAGLSCGLGLLASTADWVNAIELITTKSAVKNAMGKKNCRTLLRRKGDFMRLELDEWLEIKRGLGSQFKDRLANLI